MIPFPQTVLYGERITMSVVESTYIKEYEAGEQNTLLGSFASNGKWTIKGNVTDVETFLYTVISNYYANAEISADDMNQWVRRFNAYFNSYSAYYAKLFKDGAPILGEHAEHTRNIDDQNTIKHGYTETYKRNGTNKSSGSGEGKQQNALTNREINSFNNSGSVEFGEGAETSRVMNGETDQRITNATYTENKVSMDDIEKYIGADVVAKWIDAFHPLFMEVFL